jgi:hypothetical protein
LGSVAEKAHQELGQDASVEAVAAHAVKAYVFHTIGVLMEVSQLIRGKIMMSEAVLQGAVYLFETCQLRGDAMLPLLWQQLL